MKYLNTFGDGNKGGGTKGGANPKPPTGRNPRAKVTWEEEGRRMRAFYGKKDAIAAKRKGPPPLSVSLRKLDAIAAKRKSGGGFVSTQTKTARDIRRESISSILKDVNRSKPATKTKNRATSAIRAKAAIMSTQTKKEKLPSGTRGGPVAKNQTARGLRRESISSILKDVNRSKRSGGGAKKGPPRMGATWKKKPDGTWSSQGID